jgi:hypothetical protein
MADAPAHVTFSAAVVQAWIDQQNPGQGTNKVSDEQFGKMTAAERIEYCRRFDQKLFHAPPSGRRGT